MLNPLNSDIVIEKSFNRSGCLFTVMLVRGDKQLPAFRADKVCNPAATDANPPAGYA